VRGYGLDETPAISYEADYWEEYQRRDVTEIGRALTKARCELVARHTKKVPVDIGIGAGAFVLASCGFGYDVNPVAVEWLKRGGRFIDPYQSFPGCLTFWDSLEHIPDPKALLNRVPRGGHVFAAIPVFENMEHCLNSKHYKPGEHLWYFTHEGFLAYMEDLGYSCLEHTNVETIIGREGVNSYAFVKN